MRGEAFPIEKSGMRKKKEKKIWKTEHCSFSLQHNSEK
jgi:hypothetical protein